MVRPVALMLMIFSAPLLSGCLAIWAVGTAAETAVDVTADSAKAAGAVAGGAIDLAVPDGKEEEAGKGAAEN